MRHFLALALAEVMLAPGVLQATGKGLLKTSPRGTRALATSRIPARLAAIPLSTVAALAQAQLLAAPSAIEDAVSGFGDGSTSSSQKPGQGPSIASLSVRDTNTSGRWMGTSQKARGCHLGPSPFSEPGFPIAPPTRAKHPPSPTRLRVANATRSRMKKWNQIHEEDGSQTA
jgi:hypothetical protein